MQLRSAPPITLCGIDPGYDRLGWAIGKSSGGTLTEIAYGTIETNPKQSLFERYQALDAQLCQVLEKYQPQEASVESLFFSKNVKTALHVSEARGVVMSALFRHQVQFFEYTPPQIKLAVTGNGQADKAAIERMLRLQFSLKNERVLDDAMDALAALLTHSVCRQSQSLAAILQLHKK